MLARFAQAGMTLVMSTHNLGQAKRLATRVVYIDRGEIHADAPTQAARRAVSPVVRVIRGPMPGLP